MTDRTAYNGEQLPLLDDTFEDVMAALARAMGGKKSFAERLRPELDGEPERARRWLLDCLNPEHAAQFHVDHLLRAMKAGREAGCHVLVAWLTRETGYQTPAPAAQPSQRTLLLSEDARLAKRRAQIADDLDRIERQATVLDLSVDPLVMLTMPASSMTACTGNTPVPASRGRTTYHARGGD